MKPPEPFVPPLGPVPSELLVTGDRLWMEGRADEALAAYEAELESATADHFAGALAHKRIVSLLWASGGPDAAFSRYELTRLDERDVDVQQGDIVCCATVKDEADRLPYFLDYYERLGVDRFLFVDNESADGTRDLLMQRPNVHVWRSPMRYARANYGMAWVEVVLRAHAAGHWCLVVDTDEFLWFPRVESRSVRELCDDLDRDGAVALAAVLLDLYSDGPIRAAKCGPDDDPLRVCRFFDREFAHTRIERATPWHNVEGFAGGVRRRVFGDDTDVFLSKVPLFRYAEDRLVPAGTHGTNAEPDAVARERGALLHVKFTARFADRLDAEIRSRSDWDAQGESYSDYARMLAEQPDLTLYDARQSVELRDSAQLVELGVMRDRDPLPTVDEYVARMHDLVPGWFTGHDARLFRAVDAAQRAAGVRGDILEVGVYLGKSAILLGYLLRDDEQLVAWDLFAGDQLPGEADAAFYRDLTQQAFERNYARFQPRAPEVIARPSSELPAMDWAPRFRVIHVDGSHRYDVVRDDVAAALGLLVEGGVVVVDDYRTVPHALGVAAAAWEAVADRRLVPVLASDQKLYGCAAGREGALPGAVHRMLDAQGIAGVRQEVAGHPVVVCSEAAMTSGQGEGEGAGEGEAGTASATEHVGGTGAEPGTDDEVAELRARLALIEGSRTWRLRTRLARFLPTRR